MRNKDSGEFELVVGDRELLSGFVIGVVLLAVVFALGYLLGQNSPKSAKVAPEATGTAPATVPDGRPQPASPALPATTETAPTGDAGAQPAPTGEPAPPAEPAPQPTTVPARDASRPAPPPPPAATAVVDPANATYWQVTAASHNSAEAVFQTLKSQGFSVLTRPGPNNLTVVWVGPYGDKESLAHAKKQLEDAGFNPIKKP
jgi:cell division protein FtsN